MSEYVPKLILCPERGEFEYVAEDIPTVAKPLDMAEQGMLLLDIVDRRPVGFAVSFAAVKMALEESGYVLLRPEL